MTTNTAPKPNEIIKAVSSLSLNFWSSKNLLVQIALGEGAALMYSSIVLDGHPVTDPLFWFSIPRGIMGIASSFAAAYAGHELPRINKTGKGPFIQKLGFAMLGVSMLSTVTVMSICTYGNPEGIWKAIASTAFSVIPVSSALAVAIASGRFFIEDAAPKPAQATANQAAGSGSTSSKAGKKAAGARVPAANQAAPAEQAPAQPAQAAPETAQAVSQQPGSKMAEQVDCKWKAAGCLEHGSKGKMNGHSSHCQFNPKNIKPVSAAA